MEERVRRLPPSSKLRLEEVVRGAILAAGAGIAIGLVSTWLAGSLVVYATVAGLVALGTTVAVCGYLSKRGTGHRTILWLQRAALVLTVVLISVVRWRGPGNSAIADIAPVILILLSASCQGWRYRLPDLNLFFPVLMIIASGLVSMVVAQDQGRSLLTLGQEVYLVALWAAFLNLRETEWPDLAGRLFAVQVIVTVLVAILVIIGKFGAAGSYGRIFTYEGGARGVGLFRDPNMAAHYLGAGLFIVPMALPWAQKRLGVVGAILCASIIGFGFLATGSNGGKVGLLGGLAALGCAWAGFSKLSVRRVLLGIVVAVAVCSWLMLIAVPDQSVVKDAFSEQILRIPKGDMFRFSQFASTLEERIVTWRRAIQAFSVWPMGVGPGNFGKITGDFLLGIREAHNDPLSMLVERGLIGLGSYVWFMISVLALIWRRGRALRTEMNPWRNSWTWLLGSFAYMFAVSFSVDSFHFRHLWTMMGILCLYASDQRTGPGRVRIRASSRGEDSLKPGTGMRHEEGI